MYMYIWPIYTLCTTHMHTQQTAQHDTIIGGDIQQYGSSDYTANKLTLGEEWLVWAFQLSMGHQSGHKWAMWGMIAACFP